MRTAWRSAAAVLAALAAGAAYIGSGAYDIAADAPHWPVTTRVIETLRDRSIAVRAARVAVPDDLDAPERVRRGAGNYDAMCVGCHLKPGMADSEIRKGLYPQPPDLARRQDDLGAATLAARRFWVIKHGIKMTAMPAWSLGGVDDATIWDMVALLGQLPDLSPEDYRVLVAASPGHTHTGAATGDRDAMREHHDAPGTPPHHHDEPAPEARRRPQEAGHDHAH